MATLTIVAGKDPTSNTRALIAAVDADQGVGQTWTASTKSCRHTPQRKFADVQTSIRAARKNMTTILDSAQLREGVVIDRVIDRRETGRCIALMMAGRKISEQAIVNYMVPLFALLSSAADAVHMLNRLEDGGADKANIEGVRDALSTMGWEKIDTASSQALATKPKPPAPAPGPWAW